MASPLCVICTEVLGFKGVSATCCGHVYHEECLQKWLLRAASCPQCRKPVSQANLISKLFFSIEENDESNRRCRRHGSEDIQRLQEWLQSERQLGDNLQKKLSEEQAKHRLTRLFCVELKEAFQTTKKKEMQELTVLQNEIKEIRVSLKQTQDEGDAILRRHLGTVNTTLDSLKQREARNTDYFLRRIWRLMAEIKNRTLEVKELERTMNKMKSQMSEQQLLSRVEKKRLNTEMGLVQEQLAEIRSDVQQRDRQVSELAAENATLAILLAFEKERSRNVRLDAAGETITRSSVVDGPVAAFVVSWWRSANLQSITDRLQRYATYLFPSEDIAFPRELTSYRHLIDNYNVQKTALYTTLSVLSFYMAKWLDLNPVLVLIVTGLTTGAMNSSGQVWNPPR